MAGDFNNDARLDLATLSDTGSGSNGSVKVWLGNGAGGFSALRQFAVGGSPNSLAVADFNNDGRVDLATGNLATVEVSILLGKGDGTFQTPSGVYCGNVPIAVALGRFNADSNIDLVCIEQADDPEYCAIAIQLGNGQGGFAPASRYRIREVDDALVAADLNNDGKLDVLTSDGQILPGNGDGTLNYTYPGSLFLDPTGPSHAYGVAVGDFTGEGKPDVIVGRETLDVVPGMGNFAFAQPIHHDDAWSAYVETADFNGDGNLDAAAGDVFLRIWVGNGDGTLRSVEEFNTGGGGFAVGDFNGDGRPDLAGPSGDSVWVRLNDGIWGPPPPPMLPSLHIGNATIYEGNSGSVNATFTVSLSQTAPVDVTVQYGTANLTAIAGSDYTAKSGTVTIPAGQTSRTITVAVLGDRVAEPAETFCVNLISAAGATIGDGQGIGTITDDEPRISINNVSKAEGDRKTTSFTFTVTLSAAYDQPVSVNYATVNGTATASSDYASKSGSVTFAPGETIKTITIVVNGDKQRESNETFFVDLFGASSNALVALPRGIGTILNDDR